MPSLAVTPTWARLPDSLNPSLVARRTRAGGRAGYRHDDSTDSGDSNGFRLRIQDLDGSWRCQQTSDQATACRLLPNRSLVAQSGTEPAIVFDGPGDPGATGGPIPQGRATPGATGPLGSLLDQARGRSPFTVMRCPYLRSGK